MNDKENVCSLDRSTKPAVGRPFGQPKKALAAVTPPTLSNGPILLCQSSGDPLMIGFGCVQVGTESQRVINVFNPSRAVHADVKLDRKTTSTKGLKVYFEGKSALQKRIAPMGSETLYVQWRPDAVASLTEMIELKLNASSSLIVTVTGVAAQPEVDICV